MVSCVGGACTGCGSGHIMQPIERDIPGFIWSDVNGNNWIDPKIDRFYYNPAYNMTWTWQTTTSCVTGLDFRGNPNPPTTASSRLSVGPHGATFNCWINSTTPGPVIGTYLMPMYISRSYWTNKDYYYYLVPPAGVSCADVTWQHWGCSNRHCDGKNDPNLGAAGDGCGFVMSPGRYRNTINFRIEAPVIVPRTITGQVFETDSASSCGNTGALPLSGLNSKAYYGATQVGTTANIATDGTYTISNVNSATLFNSLTVNGSLSTVTASFTPACVRANISGCTLGSGAVVNCSNAAGLAGSDVSIRMGFTRSYNEKWFTAVDGDVYANSVTTSIAPLPSGGFSPNLINTLTASSIGGFGFTGGLIDTTTSGSGATEQGGKAERLSTSIGETYEDNWLNKFSFTVPEGSTSRPVLTSAPNNNNFRAGRIYSLSVSQFNTVLSRGDYSITEGSGKDTAIVYVTGGGTIQINDEFIADDPDNQVLLVITDSPVEIAANVGLTTTPSLTISTAAQVDLNIISGSSITTLSKYNASTSTPDNPIVINGSLMAKTVIDFKRDLGSADNILFPGEVIRFYPHLMSLIPSYEIQYGSSGIYTGLTTMDVQFDYGR